MIRRHSSVLALCLLNGTMEQLYRNSLAFIKVQHKSIDLGKLNNKNESTLLLHMLYLSTVQLISFTLVGILSMEVEELKIHLRALLYHRDILDYERDSLELFDLMRFMMLHAQRYLL